MADRQRLVDAPRGDAAGRNRRTARVLLGIMLALAAATILVGIRW
jgi:hypothetical protein